MIQMDRLPNLSQKVVKQQFYDVGNLDLAMRIYNLIEYSSNYSEMK